MFKKNTTINYAIGLILSRGKKCFENLGRFFNKSGSTISRKLLPADRTKEQMIIAAKQIFCKKTKLVLSIDDTFISKMYSKKMQGSCYFFNTLTSRMTIGYKVLVAALSDGNYTMPVACDFLYSKELYPDAKNHKNNCIKNIILQTISEFSDKKITVVMDGLFATKELFSWLADNNILAEMRMHSNRVVFYKGQKNTIKNIKQLIPKGRHMARTIKVLWHNIPLYITAQRRIDKHGNETIVYQAATYKDKPSNHVKAYKKRWGIEKMFRTTKQHLGLKDCYSQKIDRQRDHIFSVFYAYALLQLKRKKRKLKTPEAALRALKNEKAPYAKSSIHSLSENFEGAYA